MVAARLVMTAFVVVLFCEVRPVKLPLVAEKLVVKKLVEELLSATRLVILAFVVVELPTTRSVMLASVATSDEMNPLVVVLLDAVRLVIVALVVVELPMMRLPMLASVATSDDMKELVVVALVVEALIVAKSFVVKVFVTAFIAFKLAVNRFEDVALVIIDEEAKIFSVKKLRNLLSDVPIENTPSNEGAIS